MGFPRLDVRLGERLAFLVVGFATEPVELLNGLLTLSWGLWLLLPLDAVGPSAATILLTALPSPVLWGFAVLGGGFLQLVAVTAGRRGPRRIAAFVGFCSWLLIAALLGQGSHWSNTGMALALGLASSKAWVFLRLGGHVSRSPVG